MKVGILGAGNVATHLSKALINAGYPVKQIWSRNPNNAIDLALQIGANSIQNIADLNKDLDVIIIAVSDNAIEQVIAQIPKTNLQKLVIHTSGSTNIGVFNSYCENYGVLYPLQTFSKNIDLDFSSIPLFIEANNSSSQEQLQALAQRLSSNVHQVNSTKRIHLHLSAVFACNFTNHFYAIAEDILSSVNLDFDFLRPLILETAEKALLNDPKKIQTGPAKRNDQITLEKHLDLLQNQPQLKNLYSLISQDIVKMYPSSDLSNK